MSMESSKGNAQLQNFAAVLYQVCGELGAPAIVLDCLSAAASGDDFDVDSLLPFAKSKEIDGQ